MSPIDFMHACSVCVFACSMHVSYSQQYEFANQSTDVCRWMHAGRSMDGLASYEDRALFAWYLASTTCRVLRHRETLLYGAHPSRARICNIPARRKESAGPRETTRSLLLFVVGCIHTYSLVLLLPRMYVRIRKTLVTRSARTVRVHFNHACKP